MFRLNGAYAPIAIRSTLHPHASESTLTFGLASELARDCAEHGAPWISFGDVAVDDAGNPFVVDRTTTCYVSGSQPLPESLWRPFVQTWSAKRDDATIYTTSDGDHLCYGVTIPAYNAWWRLARAGMDRADYGRTWWVHASREEYAESLD